MDEIETKPECSLTVTPEKVTKSIHRVCFCQAPLPRGHAELILEAPDKMGVALKTAVIANLLDRQIRIQEDVPGQIQTFGQEPFPRGCVVNLLELPLERGQAPSA